MFLISDMSLPTDRLEPSWMSLSAQKLRNVNRHGLWIQHFGILWCETVKFFISPRQVHSPRLHFFRLDWVARSYLPWCAWRCCEFMELHIRLNLRIQGFVSAIASSISTTTIVAVAVKALTLILCLNFYWKMFSFFALLLPVLAGPILDTKTCPVTCGEAQAHPKILLKRKQIC